MSIRTQRNPGLSSITPVSRIKSTAPVKKSETVKSSSSPSTTVRQTPEPVMPEKDISEVNTQGVPDENAPPLMKESTGLENKSLEALDQKATALGIDVAEVESLSLPPALEEKIEAASLRNQEVFADASQTINVKVSDPTARLSTQHKEKAGVLSEQSQDLTARVTEVESLLGEMEAKGLTEDPAYTELTEDLKLLKGTRAVVDATQAIHEELSTHKDINRPNSPTELQNLTNLSQQLTLATEALEVEVNAIRADGDEFLPEGIQDVVTEGVRTASRVNDVVELAQNTDVLATQRAIDRPVYANGMLSQYDSYVELAENGEAFREGLSKSDWPHPERGYINRRGQTPDADGFVVFSRKGEEDADIFAGRFEGLSQEVDNFFAGEDLSPDAIADRRAELMDKIDKSFQTESGTYFVKQDRVETVKKIYGDQFDVAHAEYLAENNDVVVNKLGPISDEVNAFFAQDNLTPQDIAAKRAEVVQQASEAGDALGGIFGDSAGENFSNNIVREFDQKARQYGRDLRVDFQSTDEEVGEVLTANRTADALNDDVGLADVSGFQGNALRQLEGDNTENVGRAEAVQAEIEANQANVSTLQQQQSESADRTLDNLGTFLENAAPGTHATVEVGASIKFGVDAWVAEAEVKAGIGLSATVEKGSGQGPGYLFHADFHIDAEARGELFGIFEAKAGIKFEQTLAGIAFRTPQDVQNYLDNFDVMIEAYQNDDTEAFDAAAERIAVQAVENSYSAQNTTAYAEAEIEGVAGVGASTNTYYGDFPITQAYRTGNETREYVKAVTNSRDYTVGGVNVEISTASSYSFSDPEMTKPLAVMGSPRDPDSATSEAHQASLTISLDGDLLQKMITPGETALAALPAAVTSSLIQDLQKSNPALADVPALELQEQINTLFVHASADAILASRVSQLDLGSGDDDDNGLDSSAFFRVVVDNDGNLALDVGFDAKAEFGAGTPGAGWGAEVYGKFEVQYGRRFTLGGQ